MLVATKLPESMNTSDGGGHCYFCVHIKYAVYFSLLLVVIEYICICHGYKTRTKIMLFRLIKNNYISKSFS